MKSAILSLGLLLAACTTTAPADDDDSTPASDGLAAGDATLTVTLIAQDDTEETLDVEASTFSLWFCGEGCFSLNAGFDAFGTRLLAGWSFETPDPPTGIGDIVYANVRWDDDTRYARQGEHPNVDGDWGAAPGGEIAIDSSCEDCVNGGPGASGALQGASTSTVYDAATDLPTGERLRLDAALFRDLPRVY